MLPKYVSETQLLSTLTPERQAKFLLKIKAEYYYSKYLSEENYIDRLNQEWVLDDVIEALNLLPNVKNKQERKADRKTSLK
jgi:hypothetical protein